MQSGLAVQRSVRGSAGFFRIAGKVVCNMLARYMRALTVLENAMTKYEIMALAMRTENQFDVGGISIAARIAAWIEAVEPKLGDEEIAELIQLAGAAYRIGVKECGQGVPLEDLFPAYENWPEGPVPTRGGFRHGNSRH